MGKNKTHTHKPSLYIFCFFGGVPISLLWRQGSNKSLSECSDSLRDERGKLEEGKLDIMRKHYQQVGRAAGEVIVVGKVGEWEENDAEMRRLYM
jgi:hypothetical protein